MDTLSLSRSEPKEEALKNIREVVQMVIDELVEEGKEIPPDSAIVHA